MPKQKGNPGGIYVTPGLQSCYTLDIPRALVYTGCCIVAVLAPYLSGTQVAIEGVLELGLVITPQCSTIKPVGFGLDTIRAQELGSLIRAQPFTAIAATPGPRYILAQVLHKFC